MVYKQVNQSQLIEKVAKKLQGLDAIKSPDWAPFVKTGVFKVRPPMESDWWFTRCAAVLRSVAELGPIGTNKLVVKYGGKQRRGHKKPIFKTGSGSVARKALQQLEAAGLIKAGVVQNRKGRIVTPQGLQLLDKTAIEMQKEAKAQLSADEKPKVDKAVKEAIEE